jgi:hypothetical protein
MNNLTEGFEFRGSLDQTIAPESYLQKLTQNWKVPERPKDFQPAPEGTPTDLELAAKDPKFLETRYAASR